MTEQKEPTNFRGIIFLVLISILIISLFLASYYLFAAQDSTQQIIWSTMIAILCFTSFILLTWDMDKLQPYANELRAWLVLCIIFAIILVLLLSGIFTQLDPLFVDAAIYYTIHFAGLLPFIFPFMLICSQVSRRIEERYIQKRSKGSDSDDSIVDYSTEPIISFESLTKSLLDPELIPTLLCPSCGVIVDFRETPEWFGPTAFMCLTCDRVVHMEELGL